MHIHAFSPLEVHQGAATLGVPVEEFLARSRRAGLGTLPGTAAEILDDEVRAVLCPDKIGTDRWLEVMRIAHGIGFQTTSTIMYGHVDATSTGRVTCCAFVLCRRNWRVHRVRAAAVRPHGGADLSQGPRAPGTDVP